MTRDNLIDAIKTELMRGIMISGDVPLLSEEAAALIATNIIVHVDHYHRTNSTEPEPAGCPVCRVSVTHYASVCVYCHETYTHCKCEAQMNACYDCWMVRYNSVIANGYDVREASSYATVDAAKVAAMANFAAVSRGGG